MLKEFNSKIYKLIPALNKQDRLEASGIQLHQDYYYVVFDNMSAIAKLHVSLDKHHPANTLIPARRPVRQFEDITWSAESRRFYVVIENAKVNDETVGTINSFEPEAYGPGFKSKICEYDEHFNHLETRTVDHVFVQSNKGLEGLAVMNCNSQEYVLGLCEAAGNSSDQDYRQTGTGTVLVLEKTNKSWQVSRTIHLPPSVQFGDYAGLDIQDNRLVVVSQVSLTGPRYSSSCYVRV